MKKMKRFASLALALVMTLAMMAPVFATGSDGTITIADPIPGKTYEVYKVFDLVYEGENYSYTLPSDAPWMDVVEQYFTVTPQAANPAVSNAVVKDGFSAAAFAAALKGATNKPTPVMSWTAETETPASHDFETGELGYYFVTSDAGSLCNLTNTNPTATIYDKNDKPTIDKTVDDADRAVYVGQKLTYTVTGKVPSTTGYDKYVYKVTDRMSEGLTFNEDVVVTIGGTSVEASAWVEYADNGFTLTIPVMDYQANVGAEIEIVYTATVNDRAIVNNTEKNKVMLEYSNDPNMSDKTGETPPIEIPVYVAKIIIDKVVGNNGNPEDLSGDKLNGAVFVLQNKGGAYYKYGMNPDNKYEVTWVDDVADATPVTTGDKNGVSGYAEFPGLGNGVYKLIETEAPNGFNLMTEPVEVVIKGPADDTVTEIVITKTIANFTGSVLPSTGGIGTTIFYVVGGILVAGAAILLVTRKRVEER